MAQTPLAAQPPAKGRDLTLPPKPTNPIFQDGPKSTPVPASPVKKPTPIAPAPTPPPTDIPGFTPGADTNKRSTPFENGESTTGREGIAGGKGVFGAGMKIYKYPEEVGQATNPHYVMFYVNVPENRYEPNHIKGKKVYYDQTSENRVAAQSQNVDRTLVKGGELSLGVAGVLTGAAEGTALAGGIGGGGRGALGSLGAVLGKVLGGGVGAVLGGATGFAAGNALGTAAAEGVSIGPFQTPGVTAQRLVHMPEAIALHITNKPSASYSTDWSDQELGTLGSIGVGASWQNAGKGVVREALLNIASVGKVAGFGFDFKSYVNGTERRVRNPQKEQLFRSVGFRQFAFEYVFMPKSPKEVEDVKAIIQTFKKYMHPELSEDKMYLRYPAEFNIVHYFLDKENPHLHKISSCALRDMKVEYGGQDFTTFANTGGMPTEVYMSLMFVELETLTSNRIREGF